MLSTSSLHAGVRVLEFFLKRRGGFSPPSPPPPKLRLQQTANHAINLLLSNPEFPLNEFCKTCFGPKVPVKFPLDERKRRGGQKTVATGKLKINRSFGAKKSVKLREESPPASRQPPPFRWALVGSSSSFPWSFLPFAAMLAYIREIRESKLSGVSVLSTFPPTPSIRRGDP